MIKAIISRTDFVADYSRVWQIRALRPEDHWEDNCNYAYES